MNIAIVTSMSLPLPAVKGGGVEWLIQTIIDENEKTGRHNITIIGIEDPEAITESSKYRFTNFVFISKKIKFYKYFGYIKKYLYSGLDYYLPYIMFLNRYLKKHNFEKIIFENNINLTKCLTDNIEGEIIFHLHNDTINGHSELPGSYKMIDRVFCVSEFINSQVIKSGVFRKNRILTLPNCNCMPATVINQAIVQKIKEELGIRNDTVTFLYSGRIIREKGVLELVDAFCKLDGRINIRLIIAGGINYSNNNENAYLKEIKRVADNRVIFTGYISYEKMSYYYHIADVSVIPTLYVEEAAPLVAIESMAAGLPVIASDSGGIWNYVSEDCGIKIIRSKEFVEQLSSAISDLAKDKSKRQKMGENGRQRAIKFSKARYFENFNRLIEQK